MARYLRGGASSTHHAEWQHSWRFFFFLKRRWLFYFHLAVCFINSVDKVCWQNSKVNLITSCVAAWHWFYGRQDDCSGRLSSSFSTRSGCRSFLNAQLASLYEHTANSTYRPSFESGLCAKQAFWKNNHRTHERIISRWKTARVEWHERGCAV